MVDFYFLCMVNSIQKVSMHRCSILLSNKNKNMYVTNFMFSRMWVRPSSHFLVTKWPTTSIEFETPALGSIRETVN